MTAAAAGVLEVVQKSRSEAQPAADLRHMHHVILSTSHGTTGSLMLWHDSCRQRPHHPQRPIAAGHPDPTLFPSSLLPPPSSLLPPRSSCLPAPFSAALLLLLHLLLLARECGRGRGCEPGPGRGNRNRRGSPPLGMGAPWPATMGIRSCAGSWAMRHRKTGRSGNPPRESGEGHHDSRVCSRR
jgi:hypothetical protein